ncbi:hypothetical protein BD410DRAFT_794566, partial [Rickenella mellea]
GTKIIADMNGARIFGLAVDGDRWSAISEQIAMNRISNPGGGIAGDCPLSLKLIS